MRGEVQLGKGLQLLRRKVISIPVLRGEVQRLNGGGKPRDIIFQFPYCVGKFNSILPLRGTNLTNFNSRTAWGSSTDYNLYKELNNFISIPVLRGEVQPNSYKSSKRPNVISIPVLRGEVQLVVDVKCQNMKFQFPYCVGKFNSGQVARCSVTRISIPVLRGEVQQPSKEGRKGKY